MMKRLNIFIVLVSLAALLFVVGGCSIPVKVTGGGSVYDIDQPGELGPRIATLTVNADSCNLGEVESNYEDLFSVKGTITYIDRAESVRLRGDIESAMECRIPYDLDGTSEACYACFDLLEGSFGEEGALLASLSYALEVDYTSLNKAQPDGEGEQIVLLCLIPPSRLFSKFLFVDPDFVRPLGFSFIKIFGGPYDDYTTTGILTGNFNVKQCF